VSDDDIGGLWVRVEIEFSTRRYVPLACTFNTKKATVDLAICLQSPSTQLPAM